MFTDKEEEQLRDLDTKAIARQFNKRDDRWKARAFVTKESKGVTFTLPKEMSFMGFNVRYFQPIFAFQVTAIAQTCPSHLWPTNTERAMHQIGFAFARLIKKEWPDDRNSVAYMMQRRGTKMFLRFAEPFLTHSPYAEPMELDPSDADDLL